MKSYEQARISKNFKRKFMKKRETNFKKVKTKQNYIQPKSKYFFGRNLQLKKYTKYTHDISLNKPTVTPPKERFFFYVRV